MIFGTSNYYVVFEKVEDLMQVLRLETRLCRSVIVCINEPMRARRERPEYLEEVTEVGDPTRKAWKYIGHANLAINNGAVYGL